MLNNQIAIFDDEESRNNLQNVEKFVMISSQALPALLKVRSYDFWTPSPQFMHISRNLSVLFVHQFCQFLNLLDADVLYGWTLTGHLMTYKFGK